MAWAPVFWILYGVGSTLFVVYLFRLGKSVVNDRDGLAGEEMKKHQRMAIENTVQLAAFSAQAASRQPGSSLPGRIRVERIYQPSDDYVAVQGVRDGATCVINLPVGMLESDASERAGRGARD